MRKLVEQPYASAGVPATDGAHAKRGRGGDDLTPSPARWLRAALLPFLSTMSKIAGGLDPPTEQHGNAGVRIQGRVGVQRR